jgi:hypothetical protein
MAAEEKKFRVDYDYPGTQGKTVVGGATSDGEEVDISLDTADAKKVKEVAKEEKKKGLQRVMERISVRFPDRYSAEDEEANFDLLADTVDADWGAQDRLAEALNRDPRLGQALTDMMNGKRGAAAALARYFGKDALTAEEGSEEFVAIQAAEEERLAELEATKASRAEHERNFAASQAAMEAFAAKKGIELSEFLPRVVSELLEPIFSGQYDEALLEKLWRGCNFNC